MYELTVEGVFSAAHAISIAGVRETVHGHDWRVTATVAGESLDDDGLLCDFHTVKQVLEDILGGMNNTDLNGHDAFRGRNASAEHVARHIFDALTLRVGASLAPFARVTAVRVTESPGCAATYRG